MKLDRIKVEAPTCRITRESGCRFGRKVCCHACDRADMCKDVCLNHPGRCGQLRPMEGPGDAKGSVNKRDSLFPDLFERWGLTT